MLRVRHPYLWLILALSLLFGGLQAKLWFGQGGRGELSQLQKRVATQRAENERASRRNEALAAEVEDLKSGTDAVEERARTELGMIKPGEVFYQVIEPEQPAGEQE